MKAKSLATAVFLLPALLALGTCTIPAEAGRYTYIVKYSVSYTEPATPLTTIGSTIAISLRDSTGLVPPSLPVTSAWSEEFTFDYSLNGYDNPFTPELSVTADLDEAGDSITITVSWKDYRTDFQEVVLERFSASYDSATINVNETLFGPPLPE